MTSRGIAYAEDKYSALPKAIRGMIALAYNRGYDQALADVIADIDQATKNFKFVLKPCPIRGQTDCVYWNNGKAAPIHG